MLEVLDEDSGPKADALAAKLRNLFHEDMLRVTRPPAWITPSRRQCGGGDSPSRACCPDDVKVAGIRRNSVGLGTAFVRCPVSAAKK
ncbi:Gag-like protein, partial [Operophtera brumata]